MKKIITIGLLFAALLALLGLAAPASAGGDHPDQDNKKVNLCHATASETNPYTMIEVSVMAFYNAGHIDHEGDIWAAFSYVTVGGETVNVPAQGDTSLLAFEDCAAPAEDEPVTKPDVTYLDPCGTEDDVFSVAGGRGYTVGGAVLNGAVQTITVTLADGFVWADQSTGPFTFERPAFTDIDCDLPNTGGVEVNSTAGYLAIGAIVLILGGLLGGYLRTRREDG